MGSRGSVRAGGWALIIGALAFMGVFAFLAARFNYPEVLNGSADEVLPKLLATGPAGRAAWAFYALLPLIWLPAGVGAYVALRRFAPGAMLLALQFAVISAISMMLGLMRWPSMHWTLAEAYVVADPAQRVVLSALFDGLNSYLGNYLGEFLGELSFSLFFLISALVMRKSPSAPRWASAIGLLTAVAGLIGMFRNMTSTVAMVAEINNYLLPAWMIIFGIVLLRLPAIEQE